MTSIKVVPTSAAKYTCIFRIWLVILGILISSAAARAATIVWNAGSNVDTNWSDTANWVGGAPPTSADDAKFFDQGSNGVAGVVNNVVDSSFGGSIGSLQYGNTNGFHTTLIPNGMALNITGGNGFTVGTLTDNGSAQIVNATITGGGSLNFNGTPSAILLVDQGRAANGNVSQRAILDMSGLASFNATINSISVGTTTFGGANNAQNATGTLKLAQTNVITTSFIGTPINSNTSTPTNAVQIGSNNGNAGGVDLFFLGQSNEFFIDSIGVGSLKTTASMLFNSGLNNPVAYFRGTGGDSSRIRFWTIGDMSSSGSSSSSANGTNDFTGGTVDILVDTMSLGRDRQGGNSGSGVTKGTLTFTAGTIDVNTVYVGNQQWTNTANSNPMAGVVNVSGPTAVLKANTTLYLGRTSTNSTAALKTSGTLNITHGTVFANTVSVGPVSTNNIINMVNGTLIVSNSLATNASGLVLLNISNSTIGLTIPTNGTLRGLVGTLNTVGPANLVQLDPNPIIFPVYPTNISLIHYTNWTGSNTFALASVPVWAPGANIVSNGPNNTVDLSLPTSPAPVITGEPSGFSGSPGDNVTTNFAVVVADGSGATLTYSWYYFADNGTTNQLMDGPGPSGSSIIANSGTANMTLANAQTGDNGNYFVVVSNIYGVVTSSVVVLDVSSGCVAPQITGPNDQTVVQGNDATFTASVVANPAAYLQWQSNGVDIAGANTSTLVVPNVQYPANDQEVFSLIATNNCGDVTNSATLTVIVPPVITNQPVSLVVTNTQSASFTVVAGGVPAPTYQWYFNSLANPIPNATSATYTIANAAPGNIGTYFVIVANAAGSLPSTNVTLTVNSTMAATPSMPANSATGVCYDTPLTLVFSTPPALNNIGTIKIYNVANSSTPVDTLNIAAGNPQPRTIAGTVFNSFPVIISNNTAVIYPHLDLLTSNQTYYVTIDDGVFADSSGAYFAGITATNAWQFTTKVGGPVDPNNPVVAADGSADFVTVQGAVDSLPTAGPSLRLININNGNYVEIVNVTKSNITFRGQSRAATVVGYANNNNMNPSTGTRMAFHVNSSFVAIENMTIVNPTPQGGSQAEALMIDSGANHFILNNTEVDSRQDTILANSGTTQGYFYNSLVQGNFDYIWGGGNLFITNCQFNTIGGTGTPNLTAARTQNGSTGNWPGYLGNLVSNGFSFVECQLTRAPGVTNCSMADHNGQTNGLVSFINCTIDTAGYTNADATARGSQLLWEFGCTDLNNNPLDNTASPFLSFSQLTTDDARYIAADNATTWLNGWSPALPPNITSQPTNETVNANQPAAFTVAATGIPDPTYQWLKNGTNLNGQTSAAFNIPNASGFDIGSYAVVVSNGSGSVTSSVVSLSVIAPSVGPTLATPSVLADGSAQFTITGPAGSAGFGYRVWATTNVALTPITNTWTLLTNDVFQATPTTFTDSTAIGSPQRFYSVTVP